MFNRCIVISSSQTINLENWGIKIGDPINIICIGGGGGVERGAASTIYYESGYGGGATSIYDLSGTNPLGGHGGGGSGYVKQLSCIVSSLSVTVTIGAASVNSTGGTTSFGSYLSATGGQPGENTQDTAPGQCGLGGNVGVIGTYGTMGGGIVHGEHGTGGVGVINNGFFSVASGEGSGISTGGGAVMIWY